MKINNRILSIPPFISTSWDNVASLHMENEHTMKVALHDGSYISLTNLDKETIEKIFLFHGKSIEEPSMETDNPFDMDINNSGMVLSGMENFTGMMQHDPSQKGAPNLPPELLEKISAMGKALGIDTDTFNIPESEGDCNCPYCQISRAVHGIEGSAEEEITEDEEVSKEELTFREWDIVQKNDKLYEVSNPFNNNEKYSVYLGDPIGCTCGKNNCEHILAVLKS